ncbi:MAG: LysR family transcriptional regulator [Chloroflexi bacterium]|nr:LysR family transcriptional regulator [Chloroflexota bacterium]
MEFTNLERLSCFIEVARCQSFSRAAENLYISQPAVSRHIKELEQAVGTTLFDRAGRRVALTEVGNGMLVLAERVQEAVTEIETWVAEGSGKLSGALKIGCSAVWEYLLPEFMGSFKGLHPGVTPSLMVANTGQVIRQMQSLDIHLGFVAEAPREQDLDVMPVGEYELVVIASPEHPLAQGTVIAPAELAHYPFLMRESDSATAMFAGMYLAELGVTIHAAMELGSHQALKAGVRAGYGLGIISELAVRDELALGVLKRVSVDSPPWKRSLYILRNPARGYSPLQKAFINHVGESLRLQGVARGESRLQPTPFGGPRSGPGVRGRGQSAGPL